ncbi:hypothetical protein TRFO_14695 [Tritrichomonas foetus]|uniref:HECT domain-containing protein n=1 Tax=Tritrichomonas foetus TaxID=1144522 RepID=A0A1J4KYX6_9EUKA|nr:hypothetical protein TRFO_14695 [Tritrichomonas foetus]|eukprot:OHT14900.1 hypothetical protein TRFO_14695 [Tritrichomonas foetus]
MGHSSSAPLASTLTKKEVIEQMKPINQTPISFFKQEIIISTFFPSTKKNKNSGSSQRIHTPSLLASLLLGCYEQLDNISDILETLIKISQEPDNMLVCELDYQFHVYTRLAEARHSMLKSLIRFSPFTSSPFSETPSKKHKAHLSLSKLTTVFDKLYDIQFKKLSKCPEIKDILKHYKISTPASAFTPPTHDYLSSGLGQTEPFSVRKVIVHGICSNGHFLFVLCRETLEIFPLFNLGSLMPPIKRQFDTPFDLHTSVVADSTHLYIYTENTCREYSILDIFQKKFKYVSKPVQPNFICYVSDGILTARIDNDFHVHIYEGNKLLDKVKLCQGNESLHPSIPNLFPHTDYSLIPIEINGCFISFMFRINPANIIYRVFSLITGKHVHDDLFTSSDMCYASQTDTINRCHWVISLVDGNKFGVKRFYFPGSIDPRLVQFNVKKKRPSKKYKTFIRNFSSTVVHYTSSQVYPSYYIAKNGDKLNDFIDIIFKYAGLSNQELALQSMIIILDMNLKQTPPSKPLRERILDLVVKLHSHLSIFLFFSALNHVLFRFSPRAITMLVEMITKIKTNNLLRFAYHQLESSLIVAKLPFTTINDFTKLIPDDTRNESEIPESIQTLIFIHQKLLTTETLRYINSDDFNEIQFCSRKESLTMLDHLNYYSKAFLTKFEKALGKCKSDLELDQSFIMRILSNFLSLLSSLSTIHVISQFITKIFSPLLKKINDYVMKRSLNLTDDSSLSHNVRMFLFIYGKLAATLLSGSDLTDFEKRYIHLIRSNLDATNFKINLLNNCILPDDKNEEKGSINNDKSIEDLKKISLDINQDINDLSNIGKKPSKFLTKKKFYEPIMKVFYSKFKPFMHKNLSEELKELDRTALLSICKHLNILDQLFEPKLPFEAKMKAALDQMLKVRNSYRVLHQANQSCNNILKGRMLLKMNIDPEITATELGDFITSKEDPQTVLELLIRQKIRTDLTVIGFSLMESVLSIESNWLFIDIFSYTLAQIPKFEGLASILTITHGAKIVQIESLYDRILKIIKMRPKCNLIIAAFRFFRDCVNLHSIQNKFLNGILDIFSKNNDNYALFALSLSLINSITEMPSVLMQSQQSPMGWLLQSASLSKVQATSEFYDSFRDVFWNSQPVLKRILCRVMFAVLNSTLLKEKIIKKELIKILKFIGQTFIDFSDICTANEMIWLLRRFLTEKTHSQPILMKIILNVDHDDDVMVCGVFAVLGNSIELIRPYCNIKSHENRSTTSEYISIPTSSRNRFFCYERPFDLARKPFNLTVTPQNLIYAVAVVVLDTQAFDNFDFILSFFDECFDNLASIRSVLYLQVLGHFLKYKEFVDKIKPNMVKMLSLSPLPFHTIPTIIGLIRGFQVLPDLDVIDNFYQIQYNSTSYISYVSPQLLPEKKFDVSFKVSDDESPFYFGIISDDVERYFTRYSMVCSPSGILYPYKESIEEFEPEKQTTFFIDTNKHSFTVGSKKIQFPPGENFRIIIAARKSVKVKIRCDKSNFNYEGVPSICQHGAIMADNIESLFKLPKNISKSKDATLPYHLNDYPDIRSVVEQIRIKKKLSFNFQEPPDYVSIHVGFATHASKGYVNELIQGLFKTIALQWTTICMMRIAIQKPSLVTNPIKLFTLLSIPLEPFQAGNFQARKFPFSLNPVWENANSVYLSLDNDAKEAIKSILKSSDTIDQLCFSLLRMSESRKMHLICHPHILHTYYPPGSLTDTVKIQYDFSIATLNSFTPMRRKSIKIGDKKESLPIIINKGPTVLSITRDIINEDLSVFAISQSDNTFVFDTGFEVLLILKNLLYVAHTPKQKYTLKSAFANMFIAQSPFVLRYLAQIADYIELQMPPSPYDFSSDYLKKLIVMGGILKSSVFSDRFTSFLSQESRVLNDPICVELTKHFPEFLSVDPGKPTKNECKIGIVSLDPGTIKTDFSLRIRTLRLFSRSYTSLVGFPFWEILPYWLRITGAWRTSANIKDESDEIDPFAENYNSEIMHISNPTGQKISIHLRHTVNTRLPNSSMVMISPTPGFENSTFVVGRALSKSIEISGNHQYLALIDIPGGWSALRIEFTSWKRYRPPPPELIDVTTIHDAFIADMKEFAIDWKPEDTEELVMSLPRYALTEPTFVTTETIAKTSPLVHKFSTNVVLLRAQLLHQFNYIRTKQRNEVHKSLWESMTCFVSCEDAADDITSCIECGKNDSFANFVIDRHASQRLVVEGRGDYSRSILSQLTVAFRKAGKEHLKCKKRPWKIKFANELAIDAGGPTRELMTEVASSIFEPTTQVFIPVPNSRYGDGPNKDTFIPFNRSNNSRNADYATIGIYIGIVLRTGFAQDLPFAPIVWKYLAKEPIGASDVYAIDSPLEEQMKNVPKECELGYALWQVEAWDGAMTVLPGHAPNSLVRQEEASQYVNEVIAYRISTLKPMLKVIRNAFRENVGFKTHPLLTGKLLSRMAQGSPVIATEHLKAITVITDYDGVNDPTITRFWRVIDRFTSDQRRLLLKFVTTLTRPPNPTINPDFRIQIDKFITRNPDDMLPTASTCFNRLHLPAYTSDDICYEKLLYAVQYCQSMENK